MNIVGLIAVLGLAVILIGCGLKRAPGSLAESDFTPKIQKTEEEWRAQLTPDQYHVTRESGTERPYTGDYWNQTADGVYHCVGCGQPLYDSETKFKSGTGWPSFWAPYDEDAVATRVDRTLFMVRTELLCRQCGCHLGHVFDDGPEPTGERHCINSASLDFRAGE